MFERYTEKARRTIFFSSYEASQAGSPYIETQHLLLGLLREDKTLLTRFLRSHAAAESIRATVERQNAAQVPITGSPDVPLSHESKRVLAYAAEEGERLSHKHIGTEHLLLGLLREEKCSAARILHESGLRLSTVREELGRIQKEEPATERLKQTSVLSEFGRDLTKAAMEGQLRALLDRGNELERVIQILCRYTKKNPVLIGEAHVANISIVEALAQRIAEGNVPSSLQGKRLVALDLGLVEAETNSAAQFRERLRSLVKEVAEAKVVIVFIEELFALTTIVSADGLLDPASILEPFLSQGTIQCVTATTACGYGKVIGKHNSLARCFEEVRVPPPNEAESVRILVGFKQRYEKFYGLTVDDEAISAAMELAKRDPSEGSLLIKAADLLDDAGADIQIRKLPDELLDVQKRIKFIVHRMENAIANHEFEKARFYSDEERKERENLRKLKEEYHIGEGADMPHITRKDIEGVSRIWAGT